MPEKVDTILKAQQGAYAGARALILGGTGFLGGALAARLACLGAHVTIAALHNIGTESKLPLKGAVSFAQADLRDVLRMEELVRGQDLVFNFAGLSGAVNSNERPLDDLDVNGRGVLVLLEACRTRNPSVRIVFPGSRLQYGVPRYLPVDEAHPMFPTSMYGVHKMLGEWYHLLYCHLHGLRPTVLRISNPYGLDSRGQVARGYNIANAYIRAALEDRPLRVFGDGGQLRDYIHIDDFVEAVLLVGASDQTVGKVFNLGSGVPVQLVRMAQLVVDTIGQGWIETVPWPPAYQSTETGDFYMDCRKLNRTIGWEPKIGLAEGISRCRNGVS
jgi:UDP-glucose 4-epimerase